MPSDGKEGDSTQLGACQLVPDQEGNRGQGPGKEGQEVFQSRDPEGFPAQVTWGRLHLLSAVSSAAGARPLRCNENSRAAAWGSRWTSIILMIQEDGGAQVADPSWRCPLPQATSLELPNARPWRERT